MQSAKNIQNEFVLALQLEDNIKKEKLYFCPCCNEKVLFRFGKKILKSGKKVISHFAHEKTSDCPNPDESYEHLASKITIYENLKKNGIEKVFLEKTFSLKKQQNFYNKYLSIVNEQHPDLKIDDTFFGKLLKRHIFRPDIIFQYKGNNIAIEVQKTYLPKDDFLLRTLFYKLLNIQVIWVIPNDVFLKKANGNNPVMNISDFHKELKKYYFGNIYTWDYIESKLKVYKTENITGHRDSGFMADGDDGEQHFEKTGRYLFTYKKQKKINLIHTQNNIIDNFTVSNIKKNEKFNQIIDANIWCLKHKPAAQIPNNKSINLHRIYR